MASPTPPSRASAEPSVVVRTVGGRRIVSRTNPEISYAYGAPASASSRRARANGGRGASVMAGSGSDGGEMSPPLDGPGADGSMSPPLPPPPDAKSRYAALKESKQQQRKSASSPKKTAGGSAKAARGANSNAQDSLAEQENGDGEHGGRSEGSHSRNSVHSAGRSRAGVNAVAGRFNSFYMEQPSDSLDQGLQDTNNGIPSSLLLGAQRPSQHLFASSGGNSIHSSEAGDSRSHDYAEEARQAALLARQEAAKSSSLLASFSPSSWFKTQSNGQNGHANGDVGNEDELDHNGQPRRRRTGRTSQDMLAYRPSEDEDDSASDLSGEDRKHSRRGARKDKTKRQMRDGRDDNKIWMTSGRKRKGKRRKDANGNVIEEEGDDDEADEGDDIDEPYADNQDNDNGNSMLDTTHSEPRRKRSLKRKRGQDSSSSSGAMSYVRTFCFASAAAAAGAFVYQQRLQNLGLPDLPTGLAARSGPQSLADASKRIVQLESAYEALRVSSLSATKDEGILAARVTTLEKDLGKARDSFTQSRTAIEERVRKAESENQKLHTILEEFRGRLDKAKQSDTDGGKAEALRLQKRIEVLETSVQTSSKRLGETAEHARKALAVTDTLQASLKALERDLPKEIAVPADKRTGAPILDASTLQELRKVFAQKADMPDMSWSAFAAANEKSLRSLMSAVVSEEAQAGTTVISRALFLELLQEELDKTKTAMESRFNANAQDIQNDILAKVRSQQDMYERAGSWTKPKGSSGQPIVLKDGSDVRTAMLSLIDAALETYSADRIAMRDYALYTAGGRVIPSYTSATYRPDVKQPGFVGRLLGASSSNGKSIQRHAGDGHSPVVALHPDNTPGMCWAFQGDEGQLGISLSRRVVVSDITLEHTPSMISLEAGTSAPRDVTVWGIVERQSDVKKLAEYRRSAQTSGEIETDADATEDARDVSPTNAPPSDRHILLASITYDAFASHAVQTFAVSSEARSLEIPVAAVQVRIHSNHGNGDFTCLYRVRVHGREWTQADEQASATQM